MSFLVPARCTSPPRAYSRRIEFPLGDDEIRQPPRHMQHAQFAANEPTLTQIEK